MLKRKIIDKVHNTKQRKVTATAYLFLAPAIILFSLFYYYPTISSFFYSLNEYHIFGPMKWVGLDNYKRMLIEPIFWAALKNSLFYLLIIGPSLVVIPLFLAILLNRKLRGIYVFRIIYYLPYVASMVSISIIWKYLYHPDGLINSIIKLFGFYGNAQPINWLLNSKTALVSVAIIEIWKVCGYYMIIYLAALQSVPEELVEAAKIDGASSINILWNVTLPTLRPTIAVTTILATMNAIQIFTSVYVMTGGGPNNSTISLPMYIYQQAFVNLDMGYATAVGIVQFTCLITLTILNFKLTSSKGDI